MQTVMKEYTKEVALITRQIDVLLDEESDSQMFVVKSKEYFIDLLLKQIEEQLVQMKICMS